MIDSEEPGPGPVISRWRLRTELRRLREQRQVTQEEVARRLGWSVSKVIRIERGVSKLSVHDVHALLRMYGVTDAADVARLADWARRGRRQDWWVEYKRAIPGTYSGYVGLESEALVVSSFEPILVPGLLQTSAYARAVIDADSQPDQAVWDGRVNLRLHRQRQVLSQPNPPILQFVIDEAVLHRVGGSGAVMREQLRHLVVVAELPHVTLRVLPFAAGLHPGVSGSFVLLEFGEGDGIVNVESRFGISLFEDTEAFRTFRQVFERLLSMSLNAGETAQMIDEVARRHA
jgi:transcriptional regulator with XRE-family HTH domain